MDENRWRPTSTLNIIIYVYYIQTFNSMSRKNTIWKRKYENSFVFLIHRKKPNFNVPLECRTIIMMMIQSIHLYENCIGLILFIGKAIHMIIVPYNNKCTLTSILISFVTNHNNNDDNKYNQYEHQTMSGNLNT